MISKCYFALAFLPLGSVAYAQTAAPSASANVAVQAPAAQAILMRVAARHPELRLVGIHADVPGTTVNAIVACTDAARIGKPSSADDMALIGKPKIMVANLPQKGVYEVAMDLRDAQGHSIGMMVDQMDPKAIHDEVDALRHALAFRAELESAIPDRAALFASATNAN